MSQRETLILVAGLALAGCCGGGGGVSRLDNAGTAEKYVKEVTAWAGPVVVTDCKMRGGTRAGRCLLQGTPAQLEALATRLTFSLEEPKADYPQSGDLACTEEPGFGTSDKYPRVAPGVGLYQAPASDAWHVGPWPKNQNNVVLQRLYILPDGAGACLAFHYPYG